MSERCYYSDTTCSGNTWQCQVCEQNFCDRHGHETDVGVNVECAACESVRRNLEAQRRATQGPLLRISLIEALDRADEVFVKPQGNAGNGEYEADVSFPTAANEVYLSLAGTLELTADMRQIIAIDQAGDALFKDSANVTHGIKLQVVQRRGLRHQDFEALK